MNEHNSEVVDTLKTSIDLPLMFKVLPSREGGPTNTLPLQYSVAASGTVDTPQILANLVAHVPNELSQALHKVEYYGKDLSDEVTFCMAQYESTSASMFARWFVGVCNEHGIPFNMAAFKFEGTCPLYICICFHPSLIINFDLTFSLTALCFCNSL
jgi:hypothetical protein